MSAGRPERSATSTEDARAMSEAMLVLERQFEWIREAVRAGGPKSFVVENTIERDARKADAANPYGPPSALTYSIRITVA